MGTEQRMRACKGRDEGAEVIYHARTRSASGAGRMMWTLVLMLAAGVVGWAFPAAVWAVAILFMMALVLPFARRGNRAPPRKNYRSTI
jgi:hypothetical protein